MAKLLLALALLACIARPLVAIDGFPYCECKDYSPDNSPYTFDVVSEEEVGGSYEVCFKLSVQTTGVSTDSSCYRTLSDDFDRLEFFSYAQCAGSITSITWNGTPYSKARTQFLPQPDGGAAIKLVKLGQTSESADGTTICITAKAPCNDFTSLLGSSGCFWTMVSESTRKECCLTKQWCYAPPPPPEPKAPGNPPVPKAPKAPGTPPAPKAPKAPGNPPTPDEPVVPKLAEFPHRCYPGNPESGGGLGTGIAETPVALTYVGETLTAKGINYCFKVAKNDCNTNGISGNACCEMAIDKFELVVAGEQCRGALVDVTVDDDKRSASYGTQPDSTGTDYFIVKFGTLGWSDASEATDKEICFTLRSGAACNTMAKLAGGSSITYAYYNTLADNFNCCGTDAVLVD